MALTPAQKIVERWERQRVTELEKTKAAHRTELAGAIGLRRAILELHSPDAELGCPACPDTVYGPGDWPCDTYVLARDWRQ